MSYLGLLGFYQSYIPNYSKITSPLTDLLKKNLPLRVIWERKHEESFQMLKNILLSKPTLKFPHSEKPFVIRTDASDKAIAAVLLQEHDSVLHPCLFVSKKLCERETRWSISEREALAVVWGIGKFHKYLFGSKFILETDHAPLSILKSSDSTSPRLQRWSLALQPYFFYNPCYIW